MLWWLNTGTFLYSPCQIWKNNWFGDETIIVQGWEQSCDSSLCSILWGVHSLATFSIAHYKFTFSLALTFLHTRTHPFTSLVMSAVFCKAEVTGFLSWPDTPAGTTQTLRCPSNTTKISRTCGLSGMWECVDVSLCTSFSSINAVSANVDLSIVYGFKTVHTCMSIYRITSHSTTLRRFFKI